MITKQVIRAASGWLELGMPDDALEELAVLTGEDGSERQVLELKLSAQMAKEDWPHASTTALLLCGQAADEAEFFLSAAYCLHEAGSTAEARKCLLSGPEALHDLPVFHYNLACYLWTLGDKDNATRHLDIAVGMDDSFLDSARVDRDLVGMVI